MAEINNNSYSHSENHIIKEIQLFSGEDGFDITKMFIKATIEESIEQGFMRGHIEFEDTVNLMDTLSLDGLDDLIKIRFTTRDINFSPIKEEFNKIFRIVNWSRIPDLENTSRAGVRLDFISYAEFNDEKIKLCRSYVNTSSTEFVHEALDLLDWAGERVIEETLHARDFIAPNVSPIQMIVDIAGVSQSKDNGGSDFYFFENKDGVNFVTSQYMAEQESVATVIGNMRSSLNDYNNISAYKRTRAYDMQYQYRNGGMGMRVISSDWTNKTVSYEDFTPNDIKSVNGYLNDGLYRSEPEPTISHTQFWPKDGFYKNLDNSQVGNSVPHRAIQRAMIHGRIANFRIPGNVDITSGKVITIRMPDENDKLSYEESGKVLVRRVVHHLRPMKYKQSIEVITDSKRI